MKKIKNLVDIMIHSKQLLREKLYSEGNEDRKRELLINKISCYATYKGNEDRRRKTVGLSPLRVKK